MAHRQLSAGGRGAYVLVSVGPTTRAAKSCAVLSANPNERMIGIVAGPTTSGVTEGFLLSIYGCPRGKFCPRH